MAYIGNKRSLGEIQPAIKWSALVVFLAFSALFGRVYHLQVVKGEDYFRFAAQNSFKTREIPAPRGTIQGQGGVMIADVRPSFDVVIRPAFIPRPPKDKRALPPKQGEPADVRHISHRLSVLLGIDPAQVEERYYSAYGRARYRPLAIKKDVTRQEIAVVEAHRIDLPGVDIQVSHKRTYPFGELFSHLVGYLGEVREDELARLQAQYAGSLGSEHYEMGDYIGKYGVEKAYEPFLKGEDGLYYVQEDASGRVVAQGEELDHSEFARAMLTYLEDKGSPETTGNDLHLTIDVGLQAKIKEVMGPRPGAVVALEPDTGRVLAMVNTPSFDPEIFVRGISVSDWARLRDDPDHPLEDKALRGQYPPGSTFKMITGTAALMEGVATPSTRVYCPGYYKVGQRKFRCWKWASGGHGWTNLDKALVESCDTYFYHVSLKIGIDTLAQYMRGFGLGVPTGTGLNQEKGGLVPSRAWKETHQGRPWLPGETAAVSIGQGSVLMTPIQVARYVGAIANGGRIMEPFVVERITAQDGQVVKDFYPKVLGEIPASEEALDVVRKGMLGVVHGDRGTARRSRIPGIKMAGKTGTAQVIRQEIKDLDNPSARYADHAWFVGYAPFEAPEIVVVALVEHGGHGGAVAGPIVKAAIEYYLKERPRQARPASGVPRGPVARESLSPGQGAP